MAIAIAMRCRHRHRHRDPIRQQRSLHIAVALTASISLLCTTFGILLFAQLPDDPYHIARHVIVYLGFGAVMSGIGVYGWWRGNAHLLSVFANYLLLDVCITALPRLGLPIVLKRYLRVWCHASDGMGIGLIPDLQIIREVYIQWWDYARGSTWQDAETGGDRRTTTTTGMNNTCICIATLQACYTAVLACVLMTMALQMLAALVVRRYMQRLDAVSSQRDMEGRIYPVEKEKENGKTG